MSSNESMKVLVVEDEADFALTLKLLFKHEFAAEVTIAEDCYSARNDHPVSSYDLITLDYLLPDGDSLELLREFTLSEAHPPVIMVTGHGDVDTASQSISLGAAGYVVKDQRMSTLLPETTRRALERERFKTALRESEQNYRALFDNMQEGFALVKMLFDDEGNAVDGIYLDTNEAFGRLTGENNVIGRKASEVVPGMFERNPELFRVCAQTALTGEPGRIEAYSPPLSAYLSIKVFSSMKGQFAAVFENITERKEAGEELERINAELKRYAHIVSHDLKGPMSATSLSFEMIEKAIEQGGLPNELVKNIRWLVKTGQRHIDRAFDMVEDMLFLAGTSKVKDVESVNVRSVTKEVLADNNNQIEEKGITVKLGSKLGNVVANRTHLYRLFANLIRNSIEHNESENPSISIRKLGDSDIGHRFLINDNGQGISEEMVYALSDPFSEMCLNSVGAGLSIVKKIVGTYDGEIKVYNDNGACFEFTLKDYEKR